MSRASLAGQIQKVDHVGLVVPRVADAVPLVSDHLDRRGPGFHHMTFFVDGVPTTVDLVVEAGFAAAGTSVGQPRWSETYLSPKDTFGDPAPVRGQHPPADARGGLRPGRRAHRPGRLEGLGRLWLEER
ncbi:hypothetical protein [Pseudonocardia acidicola]|uniref:hypothetical protein n=1 Tax=Pseudonocardia acidicola TaxID=2724939 RepID=UPI001B7CEFB9|nr:hypothetical protein [Pseudonocardia acidicola]